MLSLARGLLAMYKGQSITVIIPCLNEEQGVEKVLRAMPDFVDEVIVVDNNSTDRTSEVAASLGAKVIREEVRGYGRSYKRGFAGATSDLIVTLDGDHSYPVDALSYLLEAFLHLEVDFLNASRFPVRDRRAMSFKHKFGNLVLSLAMSMLFFRWVRDSQSGMWVFRRVDSGGHEAGIRRHGLLRRDQDRGRCATRGSVSARSRSMYSSRAGRDQTEPLARRFSQPRFSAEETLLPMSITAIVPVWNGRELLERLLASLEAQTEPAAELLVVDNGSTDGAPELARASRSARDCRWAATPVSPRP